VLSKADIGQLNLQHGTKLKKVEKRKKNKKQKTDIYNFFHHHHIFHHMLGSISKQSRESVESVLKKKRRQWPTMGRICRKGTFKPGMKRLRG